MKSSTPSLRLKNWLLPIIAVLVLLLIIAWMAGTFSDRIEPGLALLEPDVSRGAASVLREEIMVTEPVPASIGARQATTISSRSLARITHIAVRAGDSVSKGQLLLELERSDLESRLQQSSEQVRAVAARLIEARQNLDRAEQLYQRDLVAAAALDEARANHDASSAELASAQQAVREAEVAITFTKIRSPIDGRVVERFAEPGDTASPGDKLLALYNPLSMRVEAAVREGLAVHLVLGQEVEVEIPVLESRVTARIEELVPAADPGSRSFMVKAQVDYDGRLLPGMYARMLIPAGTENLLLVAGDRVVNYGQLEIVWVVNEGYVDRRFIRTGREVRPGMLEVISGLEEGEQVLPPR
jgi:membrane fusion protein (multidrug efflux system)